MEVTSLTDVLWAVKRSLQTHDRQDTAAQGQHVDISTLGIHYRTCVDL